MILLKHEKCHKFYIQNFEHTYAIFQGMPGVCVLALRYTTTEGQWKESAVKLTNTLVNIRAIINHFTPKVDSWAATNNLSSLTEEQVSPFTNTTPLRLHVRCKYTNMWLLCWSFTERLRLLLCYQT